VAVPITANLMFVPLAKMDNEYLRDRETQRTGSAAPGSHP
jgi:hypothetical protein